MDTQATAQSFVHTLLHEKAVGIDTTFYTKLTEQFLFTFYPKKCKQCDVLMTRRIATRPHIIRCPECYKQGSLTAYTPLHRLRLPLWTFGWLMHESFKRFPMPVTAIEIHRRLGIARKSAQLLKRRFQLFCVEQEEPMRHQFFNELKEKFRGVQFPHSRSADLTPILKDIPAPVNCDTMALFSASQRANKGRARHRHGGLTASIYMNDKLGGKQIGSMFNTIAVKNGPVFFTSVPDQKMNTLRPILNRYIPYGTPVFTDTAYKFYSNPNHRTINHHAHSKDKRYRWARNRWSKNGVHCQTAEGVQGAFKIAMRNYRYFKPEYSPFYAGEWQFLKNAKFWFSKFNTRFPNQNLAFITDNLGASSRQEFPTAQLH